MRHARARAAVANEWGLAQSVSESATAAEFVASRRQIITLMISGRGAGRGQVGRDS